MKYSHLVVTDITDCYGSLYTHSVSWALHGKEEAKHEKSEQKLFGNKIDNILMSMSFGQTNGIPQGSALMDFIAEIVLKYIDLCLCKKIEEISDYKIIRYRDDYKIFVNNPVDGEKIVKCLSEILIGFGMRLNDQKTFLTNEVIIGSIKGDKLYYTLFVNDKFDKKNRRKHLLMIYDFAKKYPNSGQTIKLLSKYNRECCQEFHSNSVLERQVLVSMVANIAYENPRMYPICTTIISNLLSGLDKGDIGEIIGLIQNKFSNEINTGYLDIWMQRLSYNIDPNLEYKNELCGLVTEKKDNLSIWCSAWIPEKLRNIIKEKVIINRNKLEKMPPIIQQNEVDDFVNEYMY
jgi:hypothetical protein